ncbi:P2X purinoceptor 3 isoform X1 [Falco biarmicus]|uniref:P2X purinoceptor 3 isoform X1 n=1 Tax=Falco cherrug TaxID=345164 RepID=UPI002478AFAD|nr:P2X purinoceptor 3 isoform X1 [Falco cherrug]XP_055670082.1 P2X purinoceptor 3 isoform X2 [Falco peregrinus]XP_056210119.1 P2X purinoceptor 3 isoform X1 [Falco biarmicus]
MPAPRPGTRWVTSFFSYETTKSVVVKSWVVGAINRGVQLLILAYFVGWVFLHEKAYQVRDTVIESSVVTKVKGIGRYAGRVLDTADYVTPHQGTSVFVVVTKQILTENQVQGICPESEAEYRCTADHDCRGKNPATGSGLLTGRCVPYNRTLHTCEIRGWCPPEVDTVDVPVMLEAENFTLFIKNSIRFPLFGFEKANLPPPGSGGQLGRCRFHPERQPLCPILRLGDVVRLAGQDFPTLAATGGVLGIKIGWVCDLDRAWEHCLPRYSFTRLDGLARPPAPATGYNFRHARYYRWQDGTERRTLTKAFGIRFDVLVYGNVRVGHSPRGGHGGGTPPRDRGLCTRRLGSLVSSPPSSTRWQLSPPSAWCQQPVCPWPPPAPRSVPLGHWGSAAGTSSPPTQGPSPSASSPGRCGAAPHLPPTAGHPCLHPAGGGPTVLPSSPPTAGTPFPRLSVGPGTGDVGRRE